MFYYDAHNHLHDARLDSIRDDAIIGLTSCGLNGAIVNGTREQERYWVVPMRLRFSASNEPVTWMTA